MSASARFAQTDYPGEVEDLISDVLATDSSPPVCAAVGGYGIVAASSDRALIFAIAAGSSLDALPLPLPTSTGTAPPALAAWLAASDGDAVTSIGVVGLSREGVLRLYRNVPVRDTAAGLDRLKCEEIRVGNSLVQSAGTESSLPCAALHVVHSCVEGFDQALYVFGARGSAALVTIGRTLSVASLRSESSRRTSYSVGDRASLRFGSMFYSALRSIGGGGGAKNADWEAGTGAYEIVGSGAVSCSPGVVIVRKGGEVERWGPVGMQWMFNVFDFVGGRDANKSVLSAGITTDDTMVLLTESRTQDDPGHTLVCFDVRAGDGTPTRTELVIPLNDGPPDAEGSKCFMVVSGDIAYLYVGRSKMLAWLSVARGVSSEGQVQGSTSFDADLNILSVVDASFGLPEAAVTGGVAACLHAGGVWLASSAVPAPMSLDKEQLASMPATISDAVPGLWRSFLQYCADQRGAAKASLRGLVNSLDADDFDIVEALSEIVEKTSRNIVTSDQDPDKAPLSLLIDTELEKKYQQHILFMKLLSDTQVFSEVRPDAPSTTDDRLWDAIKISSRYSVVTDGEKLSSARRIRDLENLQASGGYSQRFNDAASTSLIGSEAVRSSIMSLPGLDSQAEQEADVDVPNVLTRALCQGSECIAGAKRELVKGNEATGLYRHPYEFDKFLPALEQTMADILLQLQSDQNMADDNSAVEGASYRLGARNVVLLSCEAAIAVVQGSKEARQENLSLLENGPNSLRGVGNWICDSGISRSVLFKIAEKALKAGKNSRQAEHKQVMRAATLVVDELLSCGQLYADEAAKTAGGPGATKDNAQMTPQKRRRLDLRHDSSEWGRELRASLDLLRRHSLEEDAFRLAEKYGDYGTMLALKVCATDFDAFMEDALQGFGEEFAFFAFQWLEERGHLHLLLRGGAKEMSFSSASQPVTRSNRLNQLLSEYFKTERKEVSNLAWLHWISVGNMAAATECLVEQTKRIAVPDKPSSATNTGSLCSIAKLALLAHGSGDDDVPMELTSAENYVKGRLHLSRLQHRIYPKSDALMRSEDLIRRYVDDSPVESRKLAEHVILAVEAIQFSDIDERSAQQLEDYVWRRCVERQGHFWMPLVKRIAAVSDTELRQRLKATALFEAAGALSVKHSMMDDMIERGAFERSEFAEHGCVPELARLLKTTVSLTVA